METNQLEELQKLAKIRNRKQLEKELHKSREDFLKAQDQYNKDINDLRELQGRVDGAQKQMADSRKKILDMSDFIRTMDLTGAGAVKERGQNVNYIMDGKEYHIDTSNADDIKIIPWKDFKKTLSPKDEQALESLMEEVSEESSEE